MTVDTIERELLDLGIPADLVGFKYLAEILFRIKESGGTRVTFNLTQLCRELADKYHKNYMSIYVGITSLLTKYRKKGSIASLKRVFGEDYSSSSNITATTFIHCLLMLI